MGARKQIAVDVIEARLKASHGDVLKLVRETYRGAAKKATFIDVDHGTWEAYVSNVLAGHCHPKRGHLRSQRTNFQRYGSISPLGGSEIRKKIEATNLERYGAENVLERGSPIRAKAAATIRLRYGVDNVQQAPEVHKRSSRTRRSSVTRKHWKTGDDWLNGNRVDYVWQVPIKIPQGCQPDIAGRTYYVDLLVLTGEHAGKYVEIKGGWIREMQLLKWNWFSSCHRAELWTSDVLKRMGILGKRGS